MTTPTTETLWAYAKGELSTEERHAVEAELAQSSQAREALAEVEASLSVLALLPPAPSMPDAMARRIGAALAERVDAEQSRSFTAWWRSLGNLQLLFAAASLILVAVGAYIVIDRAPMPSRHAVAVNDEAKVDAQNSDVDVPAGVSPLLPVLVPDVPVKATVASAKGATVVGGASLSKAQVLATGAKVSTEKGGSLWLSLPDGSKAGLTGSSEVALAKLDERELTLDLKKGSVAMVVPHREDRVITVRAGDVEVKDLGTRFLVSREVGKTVVAVEEGKVEVRTPASTQVVTAGRAVAWRGDRLDSYAWPTPQPTSSSKTDVAPHPPVVQSAASALEEEEGEEPSSSNPDEEWAVPPSFGSSVGPPPPEPPVEPRTSVQLTIQTRRNRKATGFSLKLIEEKLRELERQAHVPFVAIGSSLRENQARHINRLADAGACELALEHADTWLRTPASDAAEEASWWRTVMQQKVRCLNHLGRAAEALEVQRQLSTRGP